jgi:protein TonB
VKPRTIIVSLLLHGIVFGLALRVSKAKAGHRSTAVAVVNAVKKAKQEEKKKEEEQKPKPKPKPKPLAAVTPTPKAEPVTPKAAPEPSRPAPAQADAPVETGLTLGNDSGGIDIGGPAQHTPRNVEQQGLTQKGGNEQRAPREKREKVLAPKGGDNPEDDNCTEAPSKPVPLQRASEIEYTQEARANNIEGRLVLKITIGADGSVANVEVLSAVDPALDAAAVAAVKTWVFKPSMRCGKPMAGGVFTLAKRFELSD